MEKTGAKIMAEIMSEVFTPQLKEVYGLLDQIKDCPPAIFMAMLGSLIDGYADHNGMTAKQTEDFIEELLETSKHVHAVSEKGEN